MIDSPATLRTTTNTNNVSLQEAKKRRAYDDRTATDLRLHNDILEIASILLNNTDLDPVNRLELIASLNLLDRRI